MGAMRATSETWPRSWIPAALRKRLRSPYRRRIFERAWTRFAANPTAAARDGDLLRQLVRGWDNPWSANPDFLQVAMEAAAHLTGPVLECGSGLTTLVLGTLAAQSAQPLCALEHDAAWRERVRTALQRHPSPSVTLCACPLRSYGDFDWYDVTAAAVPPGIALVICDGPPGTTRGGRYGLLPVLGRHLRPGCVILLDDASRPEEQAILARWVREFGVTYELATGVTRQAALVRMPAGP